MFHFHSLIITTFLLTYESYVPVYNRFIGGNGLRGRVGGGEGALDTPGPLNGTSEASSNPDPVNSKSTREFRRRGVQ